LTAASKPSRKEVLIIGNSHTTAIESALDGQPDSTVQVVNLATFFDPINRRNKVLPDEIAGLFQPRRIYCTFGGAECSLLGLIEAPSRFDFMTATSGAIDPDREFIPHALVRATLEGLMKTGIATTRKLRSLYECPITHICTPPPFRSIPPDTRLPTVFQEKIASGVTPAPVRKKIHELHSQIARDTYATIDVGFLDVPVASKDEDGYLLDRYFSQVESMDERDPAGLRRDPTHGNELYGALVLDQILGVQSGQ